MKYRWLFILLVLSVLTIVLCACDDIDSSISGSLAYSVGEDEQFIDFIDYSRKNGIYTDKANNRMYCDIGPDSIILFPQGTVWNSTHDWPSIQIDAETVCTMGQDTFDRLIELITSNN